MKGPRTYRAAGLATLLSLALAGAAHAADMTNPVVSGISPTTAAVNAATSFSATYTDQDGVTGCDLYVNGSLQGAMTLNGTTSGTATRTHTLGTAGSYVLQARCRDAAGNIGLGAETAVTAVSDTTGPTVGAITPTSAQVGASTTFSATFSDNVAVSSCTLYVNGANQGAMTLSGSTSGTASKSFSLSPAGSYTLQARCSDTANNEGQGALTTVTTVSSGTDTTLPSVSGIAPTGAALNVATTFSATYSDSIGVVGCDLWLDGANQGSMALSGTTSGTATRALTLSSNGTYTLQARCRDAAGNVGLGAATAVTVPAPASDSTAPFAPTNLRQVEIVGTRVTFQWNAAVDNVAVTGYQVSTDGSVFVDIGNFLNATVGPLSTGTHTFSVRARDAAGNVSAAATTSVTISGAPPVQPPLPVFTLERMQADASLILQAGRSSLESSNGRGCEMRDEDARSRAIAALGTTVQNNPNALTIIANFMACGTPSTLHLGAGERLGVVNTYRAAFSRLPETSAHWFDVMKIANGRFPGETNATAEANAKAKFRAVYLREPNMSATFDANAVVIMAYGLRPLPRNLNSEVTAIGSFKAIFGYAPSSATDWDAVRAIAYSGASR